MTELGLDVKHDPILVVTLVAIAIGVAFGLLAWCLVRIMRRAAGPPDSRRVLRSWYATCPELGDPNKLVRTAVIASVPLGDEDLENKVREKVLGGDWKWAILCEAFEPTGDYRNWQVVDRMEANSALVEVISYYATWANDTIKFLRELSQSERSSLDRYINEWQPLSEAAT